MQKEQIRATEDVGVGAFFASGWRPSAEKPSRLPLSALRLAPDNLAFLLGGCLLLCLEPVMALYRGYGAAIAETTEDAPHWNNLQERINNLTLTGQ